LNIVILILKYKGRPEAMGREELIQNMMRSSKASPNSQPTFEKSKYLSVKIYGDCIMVYKKCSVFLLVAFKFVFGLEWIEYPTDISARWFRFATSDIGWSIGTVSTPGIYQTTDCGKNWSILSFPYSPISYRYQRTPVSFYGTHNKWILNRDTLRHSNNAGTTRNYYILENKEFKSIYFLILLC
jgi:hypothetical protein